MTCMQELWTDVDLARLREGLTGATLNGYNVEVEGEPPLVNQPRKGES